MEFKGTKGKWEISPDGMFIEDENLGAICQFFDKFENSFEYREANAQLIRKAPEMLEMLKNYLSDLQNIIPESPARNRRIKSIEQLIKEATEI